MSDHTDASWDAEKPDVAYENAHGWQEGNELTERIAKLEAENARLTRELAELRSDTALLIRVARTFAASGSHEDYEALQAALDSLPSTPETPK